MKTLILIINLILLISISSKTCFAAATATVNQATIYEGDPVTLTIESSQNTKPDLSPLIENFKILGTSTSSQINIINGLRSFKKSWTVELQPNSLGQIEIPAIRVGSDSTAPISLNISTLPPEVKAETSKHIFIESFVGLPNKETYVQQQIPYTVKLFYDSAMISGEFSPLKVDNAVVEQLGKDKRYRVTKGGTNFTVVEKHFVISPEKSGTFTIPPTTVKGRIALSGGDSPQLRKRMDDTDMLNQFFNRFDDFRNDPFFNDPFDDFFKNGSRGGPSKPFTASTEAIKINILPVPDAFSGNNWLPAEDLVIQDSWSKNPPELKVGEPVTRTLILQAKGLAGSQIPDINIPKPSTMKIYPEPAKSETRTDGNTVFGIQRIDLSYIPNKSGAVNIPEIKVDWWNTKTKTQETFTLPEWFLNVAKGVAIEAAEAPEVMQDNAEKAPLSQSKKINPDLVKDDKSFLNWKSFIALLLGVALIFFLIYRFVYLNFIKRNLKTDQLKHPKVDIQKLKSDLLLSCKNNDNHAAARALLNFIQAQWNDDTILNLETLAQRMSHNSEIVTELNQSLYAPNSNQWNGKSLHDLVNKGIQQKVKPKIFNEDDLEPLYPV